MAIEFINTERRLCPCGCGQQFPVFTGNLDYGSDKFVVFQAAHLSHKDSGPHVWLQFRNGPWSESDTRDSWTTLHLWMEDGRVLTSIRDPDESPFWHTRSTKFRYLTREEVLAKGGAKEWAIARRLEFVKQHQATSDFLDERSGA